MRVTELKGVRRDLSCLFPYIQISVDVSDGCKLHFWNAITAYRNVPLAYPRLMALKACKNAMKSRPCVKARAHSDGEDTREIEMSLYYISGCRSSLNTTFSPSLCYLPADVHWFCEHTQAGALRKVNVTLLCAQRRQEHAIFDGLNIGIRLC